MKTQHSQKKFFFLKKRYRPCSAPAVIVKCLHNYTAKGNADLHTTSGTYQYLLQLLCTWFLWCARPELNPVKRQVFNQSEYNWDSLSERGWRSESLIVAMRMETHEFQDMVIIFQHFSNLLVYFMFKRCVCVCFRVAWMVHLILVLYEDTWIPDISKWSKMWDKKKMPI